VRHFLNGLSRCRCGATAVEYGFILALIVIGSMVALTNMANGVVGTWTSIATKVASVI
jgi:pilus assembly protein Flp/PilA